MDDEWDIPKILRHLAALALIIFLLGICSELSEVNKNLKAINQTLQKPEK